nr:hypothetical protein [Tanacetum cinerariifolium]
MESILEGEDAMDKGVADKSKKRKPDDANRDEGPPSGSNQGLKRKKTVKDVEPSKKAKDDMGNTNEPPIVNVKQKDWFKKPERPHTQEPNAFSINRLQISDLIQDIMVGPAYKLLKGTCRSYVKLKYNMEECYKALNDLLDWNNPEDMANNLELGYTSVMQRRKWSNLDKKWSHIMMKDIDRQFLERSLMRSLEKFVGGREYEEDL